MDKQPMGEHPQRVVVLGVTGSGKTTAARRIADAIGAHHIELDALYWEPNWTEAEIPVFQQRVRDAIVGHDRWVTDGGYASHVIDITWVRADTIIWLDYPLRLTMWRLFRRTTTRLIRREQLWQGNNESFRAQFLSRNSLFLWAWTSHKKYQQSYPHHLARPDLALATIHRFHTPSAFHHWLTSLEPPTP
ncbi:MAG: adenylate kinase [Chloroflexi bacterium]|nr:adenylate kinase [Chloroflexota bacterium]